MATTATLVWCSSTISRVCCGPCGCCDSFLTVNHFCLSLSLHYGGSVAHGILVGYVKFPGEADPSVFSSSSSRSGSNSISIHFFFHFDAFFIIPPLAPIPPSLIYSFTLLLFYSFTLLLFYSFFLSFILSVCLSFSFFFGIASTFFITFLFHFPRLFSPFLCLSIRLRNVVVCS